MGCTSVQRSGGVVGWGSRGCPNCLVAGNWALPDRFSSLSDNNQSVPGGDPTIEGYFSLSDHNQSVWRRLCQLNWAGPRGGAVDESGVGGGGWSEGKRCVGRHRKSFFSSGRLFWIFRPRSTWRSSGGHWDRGRCVRFRKIWLLALYGLQDCQDLFQIPAKPASVEEIGAFFFELSSRSCRSHSTSSLLVAELAATSFLALPWRSR